MSTISFILNGEDLTINAENDERLSDVLGERFHLTSVHSGCRAGLCGSCIILFNGRAVNSCLIPVFKVKGMEVVTIEGFKQTEEYLDIIEGFKNAGVETCGYCLNAKILIVAQMFESNEDITEEYIRSSLQSVNCRCTDSSITVKGVQNALARRRKRFYGRGE